MGVLLGYHSAMEYWRAADQGRLGNARSRRDATRAARAVLRSGEKPSVPAGHPAFANASVPRDVLVGTASARTRDTDFVCHVRQEIPGASVECAGEGLFVCTPEFVFLQMSHRLDIVPLVALGYELCGVYAMLPEGPATQRETPLTSRSSLQAFAGRARGHRGCRCAARALRYVRDGSASPMETVLVMLLCLPNKLGGYGIPWPELNYRVNVPSAARRLADRVYCLCDLCWPDQRLALEYDSDMYHSSVDRRESDSRRRNTLLSLGFTVVSVSRGQVMDGGALNRLAHQVAKQLGWRLRYKDPDFTRAHLALRSDLFASLGFSGDGLASR